MRTRSAVASARFGTVARVGVRIAFCVPLALFAPVSSALLWRLALQRGGALANIVGPQAGALAGPAAGPTFLMIDALQTLVLACGLGLFVFLPPLRANGAARQARPWLAVAVCWLIGLLATAACTLQSFTTSFVLTGGGPANSTLTLALFVFNSAFRTLQLGLAAAAASEMLGVLVVLGLAAGIIIAASGLKFGIWPHATHTATGRRPSWITLLMFLPTAVCGLGLCAVWLVPVVASLLETPAPTPPALATARLAANTVGPVLNAVVLQTALAYAGALAIGALRPLGRWSEWLLLLFSPWLFVTEVPFSIASYINLSRAGLVNTFAALIPPILLSVPALFVFTLFFKGQTEQWRQARANGQPALASFVRWIILPSLPLVMGVATALLLAGSQDLLWPLIAVSSADMYTVNVALVQLASNFSSARGTITSAINSFLLPSFIIFFAVFAALQFYCDRLAATAGDSDARTTGPS
jgi:hypothetical protein